MLKYLTTAATILLLAGTLVYFVSDPVSSKVNHSVTNFTQWTPEAIAEDPVGYLNFAEVEVAEAEEKLAAARINVVSRKSRLQHEVARLDSRIERAELALSRMKDKYQNVNYVPTTTKHQTVALHEQMQSNIKIRQQAQSSVEHLDTQLARIQNALTFCQQQRVKIQASRETARIHKVVADLSDEVIKVEDLLVQIDVPIIDEALNINSQSDFVPTMVDGQDIDDRYEDIMKGNTEEQRSLAEIQ